MVVNWRIARANLRLLERQKRLGLTTGGPDPGGFVLLLNQLLLKVL